jgi:hypothetical protein
MEWIPLAKALENSETLTEAKGESAALAQEVVSLKEENSALKEQIKTLETDNADFQAMLDRNNVAWRAGFGEDRVRFDHGATWLDLARGGSYRGRPSARRRLNYRRRRVVNLRRGNLVAGLQRQP